MSRNHFGRMRNEDGEPDFVKVPRNRPGHTWDVVLSTAENPHWGICGWSFGIAVDAPLTITDITTSGTASCDRRLGAPCRKYVGGYEVTELTGPPNGVGPQTEDNAGAVCAIVLKFDCGYSLPPEGEAVVCKIRVAGDFPATVGEVVTSRVVFTSRTGSDGFPRPPAVGPQHGYVTLTEGDPPLMVEACEFRLRAVSHIAPFVRCDPNDDGANNIADAVWIFNELFRGEAATACPAAGDCNGDSERNITNGIYALLHQFTGGPPPPAPYPECGSAPGLTPEDCPFGSTRCPP